MPGHGDRNIYLLVNDEPHAGEPHEKLYSISLSGQRRHLLTKSVEEFLALAPPDEKAQASFRFGRMFAPADIKGVKDCIREHRALIKLGRLMNQEPQSSVTPSGGETDDSDIPSGYTYFGQFLAHEITFDKTPFVPHTMVTDLNEIAQERSPSIDCDSLYGAGPDVDKEMYVRESDGSYVRLKTDLTVQSSMWGALLPRDLPRVKTGAKPYAAIIGDERNDENLPLAQMHVAFSLFHNKVVDELSSQYAGQELFEKAREQVVRHLQWITLYDYLPRIIDKDVLKRVIDYTREHGGGPEYFNAQMADGLFMPVEFSVAAFRLGHSMIRRTYEWNHFHKTKSISGPATLLSFFFFTGFCGQMDGKINLMSEWIVDWKRFFDFNEIGENPNGIRYNRAKKIDTRFNFHLDNKDFSGYPHHEKKIKMRPITVRNLVRGYALRLPSGQDVASEIRLLAEERLTPEIIADSSDAKIAQLLRDSGFDKNTPLWYYILKEAEHFNKGGKLGPVGSRIVAETFVGIIWKSDHSILKDGGTPVPAFGPRKDEGKFGMVDMLKYTGITSPLEDQDE